ncbi:hypothetical protein ACH4YO_07775 [Streptomyces noursei]|uniref:hypothetical protein n=1 Tax=Streptomyces noursei TaxID=1971 RepID=UPI0033C86F80
MSLILACVGGTIIGHLIYRFTRRFIKAVRQARDESSRRDLMTLYTAKNAAQALSTAMEGRPAYAFAPPLAEGREQPIGWLWWRIEHGENGNLRQASGWAWTYARARRAAGAPTRQRTSVEVMFQGAHAQTRTQSNP